MFSIRATAIVSLFVSSLLLGHQAEQPSRPLKVLFLGDRGHHVPKERADQLIPVLHDRGIEVTYTQDPNELNASNLAKYDALIVYANIDRIEPAQEKALLDYVNGGGGFVPLHCASYCFRNSDPVVKMIGAQFQRHGTGEFDTKTIDTSHPITKGLEPFRTWDETYVHTKHNPVDRHVLQVRQEGSSEEPWTWVRTQGKGRVFYTAYGHDGRTWGNPAFHDLVERGIRWAANKGDVFDSRPRPKAGLKPFSYEDPKSPIPLYLPGRRWGTEGEKISRMQQPLPWEESVQHMVLPRGFEARLFVSEPQIGKPITMAWDHRGRLWVSETVDYPNNLQPRGEGHDQLKICEDTDGDGRADKFTVFADKLSIPTSIAFSDGGVILFSAPDTLFLKDTDGDGKADVRKVLFTGWGTRDTHAGPSNLHYGFDNWFYGIVGYSGFRGTVGGERHQFSQGFFRFRPDGSKLEFLRSTNNNSWGESFTEEGLLFGSTANGCPSVYVPIPNRYYESVRGASPSVLANIASSNKFYPITENVRQVDWHGGFTAAAGHAVYTARTYSQTYWNRTAFVAEPTGHLVATFLLQPHGTDYSSENSWNLVASDDEWTSPILAEVGPDGNVWIIDWYSFIVQHNPTPQGFQTGRGGAYVTPLRDKTHGRIYRIVATEGTPSKAKDLDSKDSSRLVEGLKSENLFWRMHAQRLLVERGDRGIVPDLIRLVEDRSVDAIGLNPPAIHALWALRGLNAVDGPDAAARTAMMSALQHPSAGVRRNALQTVPRDEASAQACLPLIGDRDPQVRLAAYLALAEMPPSEAVAGELAKAMLHGAADRDRWLGDAILSASAANARMFLIEVTSEPSDQKALSDSGLRLLQRVAEHYARTGPVDSIGRLLQSLRGDDLRVTEAIVKGLVRGWPKDRPATLDEGQEKAVATLLPKLSSESRSSLVNLATRWGNKGLAKYSAEIVDGLLSSVRDNAKGDTARAESARQLIEFRPSDPAPVRACLALITPRTSPTLASGLIDAVARSEAPESGTAILEALPSLTPAARTEAVRALLGREAWVGAFMKGVDEGKIRLGELSLDQKQALASHPNKEIAARAKALLERGGGLPDADRQKVIDALAPVVLKPGAGDATRGKLVFAQQCAKCHRHGGEGGKVGPDLTGMAAHPKAELLVHLLDPSRSVEGNFVNYNVLTTDGRTMNGLLASETKTAVTLLDPEGKTLTLLREDIEELAASKKSIMPEGFEKQVSAESIADLLEFLTQRGKYLPLDLRKVATADSSHGMFFDKNSSVERLMFDDWSPKNFEGVPFMLLDPEGGRVLNVVMLYSRNGPYAPKMPRSVTLPCNMPAKAIHFLSGVSGWGYQGGNPSRTVSMIVRLHYADGSTEDHPLRDGIEFADYIRRVDVPGSKFAFDLKDRQIRYFSIVPKSDATIESIELRKGQDATSPVVMAVTVETKGE
jgi:putative membrane-bound dehydrogenase-like protein